MGMLTIKPGAAGREVSMVTQFYAAVSNPEHPTGGW